MQLAMIGLGKMGGAMTERLLSGGHAVVATDRDPQLIAAAVKKGATGATTLSATVNALTGRRVLWLMIPAGEAVEAAVSELSTLLRPGDIIVDGGNSYYKDSIRRGATLRKQDLYYIDCGTSGGVWGLAEGYCLMVGGDKEAIAAVEPAFETLAPPNGYSHVGPVGSGHFVKMVHNGIEYALMQAYAEGFELLQQGPFPGLDLPAISKLWEHGSVVRSWLLELTSRALEKDPQLAHLRAYVEDSGEGRWTVQEGIDRAVPLPTIAAAVFARFASRQDDAFGLRLLSALRNEFGGHAVKSAT